MIRCRIAWMSDFENAGLVAAHQTLRDNPDFGDTYDGNTEVEVYEKLFNANWTAADSISLWEHVPGNKYHVTGAWEVEASDADSASSMVEEAVAKHVTNSSLDYCDAEEM